MILSYVMNLNKGSNKCKNNDIYKDASHMFTVTISVDAIFLKTILIFMLCNLINTITTVFKILIFIYYITNLILQKVTPGKLKSRVNLCQ